MGNKRSWTALFIGNTDSNSSGVRTLSEPGDIQSNTDEKDKKPADLQSRREFLITAAAVGSGLALTGLIEDEAQAAEQTVATLKALSGDTIPVELLVNGREKKLNIDPRSSLLDTLRESLDLTGSKKGCDHGQCGACTVLVDGRRINSCLTFAVMYQGKSITTIEGLSQGENLHPMQEAFIANDGFQCGYCTSGQICSAVAMLDEYKQGTASCVTPNLTNAKHCPALTDEEIKERMSGNICRCAAYPGILAAIKEVAGVKS